MVRLQALWKDERKRTDWFWPTNLYISIESQIFPLYLKVLVQDGGLQKSALRQGNTFQQEMQSTKTTKKSKWLGYQQAGNSGSPEV